MERNGDDDFDIDRLSELPDSILLRIMGFMDIKSAVHTCFLSTRWKDLWKNLTVLTFDSNHFERNQFVSSVLSCRDDSISLHKLDLCHKSIGPNLLNRVMTYAASHHVQQLMINVNLSYPKDFELPSSVFYCRSLTSLNLSFAYPNSPMSFSKITIPKSLDLPALKSLHMRNVTFATSDNGCAEPFSSCHMLNTLVIDDCYLQSDAKVLCISNSHLFSMTISNRKSINGYEIMISTPNLNLLTIEEVNHRPLHPFSSTCNITCLEEVILHLNYYGDKLSNDLVVISWLRVLAYVKIITLSKHSLQKLNAILSHRPSIRTGLPCFVNLKSLKLEKYYSSNISDDGASRLVEYLLQNSPLTRVDIIKC